VAAVLLILFPLLLLVNTRAAWTALAIAIVLLCSRAFAPSERVSRSGAHQERDASI
jgi:hypothetical protein